MGELWAARSAVGVAIGAWRASEGLEESDFAQRLDDVAAEMMEHLLSTGWDAVADAARRARPTRRHPLGRRPAR